MNQPYFDGAHWPGHDGLARRLSLGWTQAGRELSQLLLLFAVALAGVRLLTWPTGASVLLLTVVLAAPVLVCSARATSQALGAMGALWLAPQSARQQWLRGWWQMQTRVGPALALLGFAAVAWRNGLGGSAWAVLGLVLAAQALGAWSALKPQASLQRLLFAAALLWLLGLGMLDMVGISAGIAPWTPWLGLALTFGGAIYLWRLHRRLWALAAGQGQRPQVAVPAFGAGSALRAWLNSWASLELGGARRSTFQIVYGAIFPVFLVITQPYWRAGSQWHAPQGPVKLWVLGWLMLVMVPALVHRPIHWRQWLRPGGVQRHRLGWNILASTLKLQGLAGLALVALVSGLMWTLGQPADDIARTVLATWPLLFDWCVAAALAVILGGLFVTHRRAFWCLASAMGAILLLSVWWSWPVWRQGPLPTWGRVNELYVAALVAVLALLLPLANAVWARADLHRLMHQASVKTHNGWET